MSNISPKDLVAVAAPTRYRLLSLVVGLISFYVIHSPFARGKGFIIRRLLPWVLPPPPASFLATLPGGHTILLFYRERLGVLVGLYGEYERQEMSYLCRYARLNTVAVDVGANIGLFTLELALAVGTYGRVFAFEPWASNQERLRAHCEVNHLENIVIYPSAVGAVAGETPLHLSDDPGGHSTKDIVAGRVLGKTVLVQVATLDRVWREAGAPDVSVMKVDVEGDELAVLRGSDLLLAACRPVLLVEASTPSHLKAVAGWLEARAYEERSPEGFGSHNHLFLPSEVSS